jgi:hypothetical protein
MSPFIGSEAIARGALTRARLRWNYTAILPDVYVANGQERDVRTNTEAAWLWTRRTGIVAGRAAAALHGASAVSDLTPIELIAKQRRRQQGVILRDERIEADEVQRVASMRVTSPARTAFDLARHLPRDEAIVILDQLAAVTGVDFRQAVQMVYRYRGARGVEPGWTALSLMDGGARSPMETKIRLALVDGGLPAPRAGIVVGSGPAAAVIGMGWERAKVGVSYYETEELFTAQRILREELLHELGWFEIQVIAEHSMRMMVLRAREALRRRERHR